MWYRLEATSAQNDTFVNDFCKVDVFVCVLRVSKDEQLSNLLKLQNSPRKIITVILTWKLKLISVLLVSYNTFFHNYYVLQFSLACGNQLCAI